MISRTFVYLNSQAHTAAHGLDLEVNNFIKAQRRIGKTWLPGGSVSITFGQQESVSLWAVAQTIWLQTEDKDSLYAFFYPESNGQANLFQNFETWEEAVAWWNQNRPDWKRINATGDDLASWLNPATGAIVALRPVHWRP